MAETLRDKIEAIAWRYKQDERGDIGPRDVADEVLALPEIIQALEELDSRKDLLDGEAYWTV